MAASGSRATAARVAGAYAVLGVLFLWPLVIHPGYFGRTADWAFFHFLDETFLRAVHEHGVVALWNPWYCGGSFGLANPQSQVLSPAFWVSLLFGSAYGLKFRILAYFTLGAWGAHRLAADVGIHSAVGRFAAGATFVCCGFFAWHVSGGHSAFLPFYLLPIAWLCYRRGVAAARPLVAFGFTVGLGATWTLMVFDGSVYPVPFSALLIGINAAWDLLAGPGRRQRVAAVLVPLGAGILFALLGAPKIWLVLDVLTEFPREVASKDRLFPRDLVTMLLSFRTARKFPPHVYVWPEYGAFIGPMAIALAAYAAFHEPRRHLRLLVPLAFFLALLAGNHGPLSPFELLRRIPPFGSLRLPSRHVVVVVLLLALLAGFTVDRLWCRLRASKDPPAEDPSPQDPGAVTRLGRAFGWALLCVWVIDGTPWLWLRVMEAVVGIVACAAAGRLLPRGRIAARWHGRSRRRVVLAAALVSLLVAVGFNGALFYDAFSRPPDHAWREGAFSHRHGAAGHMYRYVWKNWGSVRCYDPIHVRTGAIRRNVGPQAWLAPPAAGGSAPSIVRWSPNEVVIHVETAAPARLVWNMNYHRDWRAPPPLVVASFRGLVSVDLPAGIHELTLRYVPRLLHQALAASLGTSCGLLLLFTVGIWRQRRAGTKVLKA